ncbi:MAG: hypothetical protein MI806_24990 [Minwuiales bacterium]|nr:hypothetical protein [Minwuiales bacterium]
MIHLVTPDLYDRYRSELQAMYRLRCRVFKERLDWEVDVRDGEERDRFDLLHPTYVLAYDRPGELLGTMRLLPSTGPYMLRDVFPVLLEGRAAPTKPGAWESSRFAVDCDLKDSRGLAALNRVTGEMFCGVIEHCLANDIDQMLMVYDVRVARLLRRLGGQLSKYPIWRSRRHQVGKTIAYASQWHVNRYVLETIRARCGISGSVLADPPHAIDFATRRAA